MEYWDAQVRLIATTRQASLLTTSAYTLAGFGFLFWVVVAHLAAPDSIGLAVTAVSLSGLLASLSLLGTDFGVIRFLPTANNPRELAERILRFVLISSSVSSVVAMLLLWRIHSILPLPYLPFLASIAVLTASSTMIDTIFIALRRNELTFQRALAFSVAKLALIPVMVAWGGLGIATSYALGLVLGILVVFRRLRRVLTRPPVEVHAQPTLKSLASFSFLNFVSVIGFTAVDRVAPTLILIMLTPRDAAYFYIPYVISQLLFYVPESFSKTLFAEGSSSRLDFDDIFRRSLARTLAILVPVAALSPIWAPLILTAFGGSTYAAHWPLLTLLCVSTVGMAVMEYVRTFLNLCGRTFTVAMLSVTYGTLNFIAFLSILTWLRRLDYVGFAWVISSGCMALCAWAIYRKQRAFSIVKSGMAMGSTEYRSRAHYMDPSVAASYERRRFHSVVGKVVDHLEKEALRRALRQLPPGSSVCEVASGTGRMTEVLLEACYPTLATDISPAMLSIARGKLSSKEGLQGVVLCDATSLPFQTGSFDAVVAVRFMSHLPPPVRTLVWEELARICRSRVIVSVQMPFSLKFLHRYIIRFKEPIEPPYSIPLRTLKQEAMNARLRLDAIRYSFPLVAETCTAYLEKAVAQGRS